MAHGEVHHDYHLVDPSPWPVVGAAGAFVMLIGAVFWMNAGYTGFFGLPVNGQPWIFIVGLLLVLYTMAGWWRDVVRESVVRGDHTPVVKLGLRYGMILFIASEVMFFFAWFWAFFNSAIIPPRRFDWKMAARKVLLRLIAWHLPLLNTVILLTSGTTVTWAHHCILNNDRKGAIQGLLITVALGLSFTCVQAYEYSHATFTFGLNGAKLMPFMDPAHKSLTVGDRQSQCDLWYAGFLHGDRISRRPRHYRYDVSYRMFVPCNRSASSRLIVISGLEAAAWYWHFVDVVWLFLFACIYVWGASAITE